MSLYMTLALCTSMLLPNAMAQVGRWGGGARVNVQNRSADVNRTYNNTANVNRNINVNENVNVNRNVNVNTNYHGGYYYHDNDWNWGSFAAGAAAGAVTTAAVAGATHPAQTAVVTAPAVGAMVPALPSGCAAVGTGGAVLYNCNHVYYRPYYQGTTLVYQVVTYP
jgi:hypothetical protein